MVCGGMGVGCSSARRRGEEVGEDMGRSGGGTEEEGRRNGVSLGGKERSVF